jgi:hypothetical protein
VATTSIKDGFAGGSDNQMKVNADGSINVDVSGGGGASNVNLIEVGGTAITLGQTTMALSIPVTIASDQSPIAISGTITGNVDASLEGLNAFQTSQYTIGVGAVQITPTPLAGRSSISIKVTTSGNAMIYIGNSNAVTTTTGFPMVSGDNIQMDLTTSQSIYAISNMAGQLLYALEIG